MIASVIVAAVAFVLWFLSTRRNERIVRISSLIAAIIFSVFGAFALAGIQDMTDVYGMMTLIETGITVAALCILPSAIIVTILISSKRISAALMYILAFMSFYAYAVASISLGEDMGVASMIILTWITATIFIVVTYRMVKVDWWLHMVPFIIGIIVNAVFYVNTYGEIGMTYGLVFLFSIIVLLAVLIFWFLRRENADWI